MTTIRRGERKQYSSGMKRDSEDGKLDYTLLFDDPLADRYVAHLTEGARHYGDRNWMKASTEGAMMFLERLTPWKADPDDR